MLKVVHTEGFIQPEDVIDFMLQSTKSRKIYIILYKY